MCDEVVESAEKQGKKLIKALGNLYIIYSYGFVGA